MTFTSRKRTGLIAFATIVLLFPAYPSIAANSDMLTEFGRTCVASRSLKDLKLVLAKDGWKAFASLAQSHLELEIKAVTPMLETQGLSSDYVIYGRDVQGKHFELALSATRKPIRESRKLIGCSMYDFNATAAIASANVGSFAPNIQSQKSQLGDVQIEKWDNLFDGSGMRAVFVPTASPMRAQLGFTGMMLGTHFLDAAD